MWHVETVVGNGRYMHVTCGDCCGGGGGGGGGGGVETHARDMWRLLCGGETHARDMLCGGETYACDMWRLM